MKRLYRVITKDFGGGYTVMTDYKTKAQCKQFILGRWGHHPSFAFISKARTDASLQRYFGV